MRNKAKKLVYSAAAGDRGVVLLDGKEMDGVLRCSPSQGWIEVYLTDENGRAIVNDAKQDIVVQRLDGRVQFFSEGGKQ